MEMALGTRSERERSVPGWPFGSRSESCMVLEELVVFCGVGGIVESLGLG